MSFTQIKIFPTAVSKQTVIKPGTGVVLCAGQTEGVLLVSELNILSLIPTNI